MNTSSRPYGVARTARECSAVTHTSLRLLSDRAPSRSTRPRPGATRRSHALALHRTSPTAGVHLIWASHGNAQSGRQWTTPSLVLDHVEEEQALHSRALGHGSGSARGRCPAAVPIEKLVAPQNAVSVVPRPPLAFEPPSPRSCAAWPRPARAVCERTLERRRAPSRSGGRRGTWADQQSGLEIDQAPQERRLIGGEGSRQALLEAQSPEAQVGSDVEWAFAGTHAAGSVSTGILKIG